MRSYKLVLVLKSSLTLDKKKKLISQVEAWSGAKDNKITELGEKKFAYAIKHGKKGDYVAMEFNSDSITPDFEKRLVITEDILRHLMVRTK